MVSLWVVSMFHLPMQLHEYIFHGVKKVLNMFSKFKEVPDSIKDIC